jgi:CBS domain-containing protein/RimJ/RimL family protein N-acetyltransferase
MGRRLEESTIYCFPHAFINRKGEPILIATLDDKRCQRLIEMYLAYQPRSSFQGLPPIKDEACVKWVQYMIGNGINLVALSFGEGVVGHVALFPANDLVCEILVVVSPPFQDTGIGTELVRCGVQLAHEIGFERVQLSVEATNVKAKHVYRKCGFESLSGDRPSEVDMVLDLKRYRATLDVTVAEIMNTSLLTLDPDQPCKAALEIFLKSHVGSLPVVDADGKLVGILSKTDLLLPAKIAKRVRDILTRQVLTVRGDCPVAKVVRMFQSTRVRCIPVVDREMKLVGVVGRQDVLAHYAKRL